MRSSSLHNFVLPPPNWGRQRRMKCFKAAAVPGSSGDRSSPSTSSTLTGNKIRKLEEPEEEEKISTANATTSSSGKQARAMLTSSSIIDDLEELRQKLKRDLKDTEDKINNAILRINNAEKKQVKKEQEG